MRSVLLLSTLGCAFFSAIDAFKFTGPDSDEKLNITQPITISWDAKGGDLNEPEARALNLWFSALVNTTRGGWEIASNLSLSSGSYKWDPNSLVQIMKDHYTVSPNAEHYFEAKLIGSTGNMLATVETEKYALEGYDFIRNSGGKGAQPGFYTTVAMAVMAGVVAGGVI
ncbi:hypothetical protein FVEN_g3763 [Fusarium venenatum]|uniref:Uncharacterized protein n=1 Tax=Fusarium venenatum TaxID=56646 RepID=A0A2L2SRV0_9HYPO|nr:uncharacterized protein FVRRES_13735 [Fusarium venenatum]KAG8358739.1 hypothetical protein FVEN_g3763 [Fusarium venenatum]KAH6980245.1 hypothetical protein EDB82DRAFT_280722 [Fusarium venenatum]CEI41771.1 unnamed protein product [Fusarium venenatum]